MALGSTLVTASHQGVDGVGREAQGTVAGDVRIQIDGAEFLVGIALHAHGVGDYIVQDVGQGRDFVKGLLVFVGDFHADDDVGAHVVNHVGGEVVDKAAVHEHLAVNHDGREYAWNGHAGAHGVGDAAVTDVDFLAGGDVSGHAGERDGQFVEVDFLLITDAKVVEEVDQGGVVDVGAGKVVGEAVALAFVGVVDDSRQAEGDVHEHGAVALAHLGRHGGTFDGVADVFGPIHVGDELGEFVRGVAHGIKAANDGAHAGAGYVINGDAHFFDVFQYPDVGGAFGAATAQHHAHFGAWCVDGDFFLFLSFRRNHEKAQHGATKSTPDN